MGRAYWVQTPNRWFPGEHHLLTPLGALAAEALPARHRPPRTVRGAPEHPTPGGRDFYIENLPCDIRLLDFHEVGRLFPGARIVRERFPGITRSPIACRQHPAV